jgi:hypothetical protein
MFNIKKLKTKTYIEIPSHPRQTGNPQENKQQMLVRMWGKRNPHTLVGVETDVTSVEISMEVPQKTKVDLPYDPAIPLLGMYLK